MMRSFFPPRTPRLRVSTSGQKQQVPSSRMEGAVTFFALQRLVGMQAKLDSQGKWGKDSRGARRRGGHDEALFSPRTPRLRVSPSGQKQQVP
jgi:hypothetical protein